jgi:hypothetical protein
MFLDINDKYCACYNKNAFKPVLLPLSFKEQYLNGEREINDCSDKLKQLLIKNYLAFEDIELSREELYLKIKNDFDDKNHTLNVRFVPSYNCDKNCSYCLIQDIRSKMKEYFDFDYLFYQELSDDTSWLPDFNNKMPFPNKLSVGTWHWKDK